MKLLKKVFLITLVCLLLAGCAKTVKPATSEEKQAIQNVIMAYDKAYFNWDLEAASKCVTADYTLEDTEVMIRNALGVYVEQGDILIEDIDKYLEIEKKAYQKGAEQLQYRGFDIKVSGDTATAFVTYGYPNIDAGIPTYGEELTRYRNAFFMSVCGMDEATAKVSLSPEEFSSVYLKVVEMDYAVRNENVTYIEDTVELRLQRIDGKWLISELVLPEE